MSSHMDTYYMPQGRLFIAKRDAAGNPGVLRFMGDVTNAAVNLKSTTVSASEHSSGKRLTAKVVNVGNSATFDFTLMSFNEENVALALYGDANVLEAGAIVGELLPIGIVAGDRVALKRPRVSNVMIVDSAPVPATLDSAKYVVDGVFGAITINDVVGMVQPLKVSYEAGLSKNVAMFSKAEEEVFYRFEGINTADNESPLILELYRASTAPLKKFDLIMDKLGEMQLSSEVLADPTKSNDSTFGLFGRYVT